MEVLLSFLATTLVIHIISSHALGLEEIIDTKVNVKKTFCRSLHVFVVVLISTLLGFLLNLGLKPLNMLYLTPFVQVLLTFGIIYVLTLLTKKEIIKIPYFDDSLELLIINSAVIGIGVIVLTLGLSFLDTLLLTFAYGIGYTLFLVIYAAIKGRTGNYKVPKALEGLPIALITIGLMILTLSSLL